MTEATDPTTDAQEIDESDLPPLGDLGEPYGEGDKAVRVTTLAGPSGVPESDEDEPDRGRGVEPDGGVEYTPIQEFAAEISGKLDLDARAAEGEGVVKITASPSALKDSQQRLEAQGYNTELYLDDIAQLVVHPRPGDLNGRESREALYLRVDGLDASELDETGDEIVRDICSEACSRFKSRLPMMGITGVVPVFNEAVEPRLSATADDERVVSTGDDEYVAVDPATLSVLTDFASDQLRSGNVSEESSYRDELPDAVRVGYAAIDGYNDRGQESENANEPTVTTEPLDDDVAPDATSVYVHRDPMPGGIRDAVFCTFDQNPEGLDAGGSTYTTEWVENQVFNQYDGDDGALDELVPAEADREAAGDDPVRVGRLHFDRATGEVVALYLDPDAFEEGED